MTRLQSALRRLYLLPTSGSQDTAAEMGSLVDAGGQVRALVLELARPADWAALSAVWTGVQADLALPAPAIAVTGQDGYQLWFSLAQAVPAAQATAFLDALRLRYLGDIKPQRVAMWPQVDTASPLHIRHARPVPALQPGSGLWSAFIAQDLAPMFSDEPWLDLPPNPDGQCNLLARLASIQPDDLVQALHRLQPASVPGPARPAMQAMQATPAVADAGLVPTHLATAAAWQDPKAFLLDIMNNPGVALALRIEAAKALLPHSG